MPVSNLVRLTLLWSGGGEIGTTSWSVGGLSSTPDESKLSDFLAAVDDGFLNDETPSQWANFTALMYGGQSTQSLTAYSYANSSLPSSHMAQRSTVHPGQVAGGGPPLQVAVVASLRTSHPGRAFRGRQYFPGATAIVSPTAFKVSNGVCDNVGGCAAAMGAIVKEAAQSTFATNSAYWGVFSRTRSVVTPILQVLVDNVPDVQRRRANSLVSTHTSSFPINSNP